MWSIENLFLLSKLNRYKKITIFIKILRKNKPSQISVALTNLIIAYREHGT